MEPMEKVTNNEEIEIDLKEVFYELWDKAVIIVLSAVVCALAMALVTVTLMTSKYQSTASLYVMNRQNSEGAATSSDISAATSLTNDFKSMITSNTVMEQAIERLGLTIKAKDLSRMVSVSNPTNTRILDITVTSEDPYEAKQIVDVIAEISANQIVDIMGLEKVNVYQEGEVPTRASSPNLKKNLLIGAAAGFLLACVVILAIFFLDDSVKTEEDVEKYLGKSVLAMIPEEGDKKKEIRSKRKKSPVKKKRPAAKGGRA
ncbi:MAG: protein-tyrosine kinase [Lachnospiraceae bacterium]|nr:protein-tyrosine kinase [Lachnospiraceae bacterium]